MSSSWEEENKKCTRKSCRSISAHSLVNTFPNTVWSYLWVQLFIGKLSIYIHLARQSVVCPHNNLLPLLVLRVIYRATLLSVSLLNIQHCPTSFHKGSVSSHQVILYHYIPVALLHQVLIIYYILKYIHDSCSVNCLRLKCNLWYLGN